MMIKRPHPHDTCCYFYSVVEFWKDEWFCSLKVVPQPMAMWGTWVLECQLVPGTV